MLVVYRHATCKMVPSDSHLASTRSQVVHLDKEEDWNVGGEEVELAIHNHVFQPWHVRQLPDDRWIKSIAWKIKFWRHRQLNIGGYAVVSQLLSLPAHEWGCLNSIAEVEPEWSNIWSPDT